MLMEHYIKNKYLAIILSVVLNGCQTWSFTWRKVRRLRVFENRILKRTFRPKRDESGNGEVSTMMTT